MICAQCRKEIDPDSNFCIYCGSQVDPLAPVQLPAISLNEVWVGFLGAFFLLIAVFFGGIIFTITQYSYRSGNDEDAAEILIITIVLTILISTLPYLGLRRKMKGYAKGVLRGTLTFYGIVLLLALYLTLFLIR